MARNNRSSAAAVSFAAVMIAALAALLVIGLLTTGTAFGLLQWVIGATGFQFPGVLTGSLRIAGYLTLLGILAIGAQFIGLPVRDRVPFYLGLAAMFAAIAEFVVPGFVAEFFAPLVELLTGVPFGEWEGARFIVWTVAFILVYYVVEVRLSGAIPSADGAKSASGVVSKVQSRLAGLFREYRDMFIKIAAGLGILGVITASGAGQSIAAFLAETAGQSPVWFGWISTLVGGYLNFAAEAINLTPTQFGVIAIGIVAVVAYLEYETD